METASLGNSTETMVAIFLTISIAFIIFLIFWLLQKGDSRNKSEETVQKVDSGNNTKEEWLKGEKKDICTGDSKNKSEETVQKVDSGNNTKEEWLKGEKKGICTAQSENQNPEASANGDSGNKNKGHVPEELYEPVDDKTFALTIGNDWKTVGNILVFQQAELEEITHSEKQLRDVGFAFIRRFRQKYGSENNELTKALLTMKRFDLLKRKQGTGGSLCLAGNVSCLR